MSMLDEGLEYFHIRKPHLSKREIAAFISQFHPEYRARLMLHSYHDLCSEYKLGGIHLTRQHRRRSYLYRLSLKLRRITHKDLRVTRTFHKLSDLTGDSTRYSYAFLSPVYDSISQSSLGAGFSKRALHLLLPKAKQPVLALGGIRPSLLPEIRAYGYAGAALHGCLWEDGRNPLEVFLEAKRIAAGLIKSPIEDRPKS